MATTRRTRKTEKTERRTDALTRERIVEAAVELLDSAGEGALTFRALTERLATGPGAIYHHVANKSELLEAATEAVIAEAVPLEPVPAPGSAPGLESASAPGSGAAPVHATPTASPHAGIHAVALGLFDAIDEHPWIATQLALQLSRNPWGPVTPRILEGIGRQVRALGVPEGSRLAATSALMHYILGAAGQNAANGRAFGPDANRGELLDTASSAWKRLDPAEYPFTRQVADELREHDDRRQFLAGIALILAGITALHPPLAQS